MLQIGMLRRHSVNQVFTPRRTEVNRDIYVDRQTLETELQRALNGSLHPIVFGESGSGKSWLYKKVLDDMKAEVFSANCANATPLRLGSLTEELGSLVTSHRPKRLTEMAEEMNAGVKAVFAEGGLKSTRKYEFGETDPLLECFALLRSVAGNRPAVLVIDNIEMIFQDEQRMGELASIITLLDDSRYASHNVKLLIVGVPSEIRNYLSRTNSSVANRVVEVSEISALTMEQVSQLVEKGFIDLLKVEFSGDTLQVWKEHIFNVTMGFAQPVQEYCEQLGYIAEDAGWKASPEQLSMADATWFKQGLNKASTVVAGWMNERETKAGRRNQVLYSLGKIPKRLFHVNEVENILRQEFPDSTADVTLAVGQILSELASGEEPIIKRSSKSVDYEFRDARYAMALRVLLQKDLTKEKVLRAHGLTSGE
jgi:AAA domain